MTTISASNSLLQEVLRPQAFGVDRLGSKLAGSSISRSASPTKLMGGDDSDDELVGVVSVFWKRNRVYQTTYCAYRHLFLVLQPGRLHHLDSLLALVHLHV